MDIKLVNKYKRIANISERRRAFAEDLINFYNLNNRSFCKSKHSCRYAPAHTQSPGCAIGRCLPVKLGRRLDKLTWGTSIYSVMTHTNTTLPSWLTEMGLSFLCACQHLHDDKDNWSEMGMTKAGQRYYQLYVKPLI